MGVYGLWRLIDATGKPVPLESLEGKVLAIDVSIWIHQVIQGYQDRHGNAKPNAHLLGLFHRICKLLYYKVKPVFVFDGGVPMLKRNVIALRRKQKSAAISKAQRMKTDLINNLIKRNAVISVLNPEGQNVKAIPSHVASAVRNEASENNMFALPSMPSSSTLDTSDAEDSDSSVDVSPRKQTKWMGNIHNVDVGSAEFKALPADVRYDILTDLKETRKQNSWGRLHEMPERSQDFSGFQMRRLLKRRLVQESLESAEKEMGGKTLTLEELDKLLTEQGITTKGRDAAYRIAADNTTRLIYISDKNQLSKNKPDEATLAETDVNDFSKEGEEPVAGSSKESVPITEDMEEYEFNNYSDSDVELISADESYFARSASDHEEDANSESDSMLNESRPISKKYFGKNTMNPALAYMLENSDLTQKEIVKLLEQTNKESRTNCGRAVIAKESSEVIKTTCIAVAENREPMKINETAKNEDKLFDDLLRQSAQIEPKPNDVPITVGDNSHDVVSSVKEVVKRSDSSSGVSESDSDDFIEISDVPIPIDLNNTISTKPKPGIEITIKPDMAPEDDLFANVFDSPANSSKEQKTLEISTESIGDTSCASEIASVIIDDNETVHPVPISNESSNGQLTPVEGATTVTDQKLHEESVVLDDVQPTLGEEEEGVEIGEIVEGRKSNSAEDREKLQSWIEQVKAASAAPPEMSEKEFLSLQTQLENEQDELTANIGKLERQATGISDQIRVEAQELLRLFGIPYIVAPMEAEAQCAYLEQIKLTDGTITDDSDIWLFGGKCVYKNFFNHSKQVLRFQASDIQYHFKLTRDEMIQLALLVGSDYTEGLSGIGPVTALEILAAFPTNGENLLQGLMTFSSWVKSGKIPGPGKTALRNKLKNVQLHEGFPSQSVVQAYLCPAVDESKEAFSWGKPNLVLLSDYTRLKFGWTKARFEDQIKFVLKRLNDPKGQRAIDSYFKLEETQKCIKKNLSKRIQNAVKRLNRNSDSEEEDNQSKEKQTKKSKRGPKTRKVNEDKEATVESQTTESIPVMEEKKQESPQAASTANNNNKKEEYIPQREKDKAAALQRKLQAIEVLRKSKQGLCKTKKVKRCVRKMKQEAELSESDSTD